MAKLALYQKYRSSTFDEVVGQEYVVRSIKNAVRDDKIGHAYLFCGPRGTGKTTMARLLAKAVNCENPDKAPCEKCESCTAANAGTHPDIVEINAANETHVEDIRDLIERSTLAPMQGKHKVYIIDEVHQLSSAASSALLKTLEEPPEHVIFVLATTDPQKLLPTIISRCQRFDFSKLRKDQICAHLMEIAKLENIYMEEKAADMIAVLSDGGMRDALSIMDQCAAYTDDHISEEAIDQIYGMATTEEKIGLLTDIADVNLESLIARVKDYEHKGIDLQRFTDGMIDILKDCLIYKATSKAELLKVISREEAAALSDKINQRTCMHMMEYLIDTKDRYKTAVSAVTCFEVTCLALATEDRNPVQTVVVEKKEEPAERRIPAYQPIFKRPDPVVAKPAEPEVVRTIQMEPIKPAQEAIPQEQILGLLVQCNKAEKAKDEAAYARLKEIRNTEFMKYTLLLEDTKIGACGEKCTILLTQVQATANRINSQPMNEELCKFVKENGFVNKVIFAITEKDFKAASKKYIELMRAGTLPEPYAISLYKEEKKETTEPETAEQKVLAMFGADEVDIV